MVKRYNIRELTRPLDLETLAVVYENAEVVLGKDYDVLEASSAFHARVQADRIAQLEAALREIAAYRGKNDVGHRLAYIAEVAMGSGQETACEHVWNEPDVFLGGVVCRKCGKVRFESETGEKR